MRKNRSRIVLACASVALVAACEGSISDPGATPGEHHPPIPGSAGDVRIERRVWRLSPLHYGKELERLFGDGVPTVDLPGSAPEHHLTNIAASARVDVGNATQFTTAAHSVATWVTANPSATRCATYGTPACVDTLLSWLPEEAFRRPVSDAEVAALRALFDQLSASYDYDYAFAGLVRTILLVAGLPLPHRARGGRYRRHHADDEPRDRIGARVRDHGRGAGRRPARRRRARRARRAGRTRRAGATVDGVIEAHVAALLLGVAEHGDARQPGRRGRA